MLCPDFFTSDEIDILFCYFDSGKLSAWFLYFFVSFLLRLLASERSEWGKLTSCWAALSLWNADRSGVHSRPRMDARLSNPGQTSATNHLAQLQGYIAIAIQYTHPLLLYTDRHCISLLYNYKDHTQHRMLLYLYLKLNPISSYKELFITVLNLDWRVVLFTKCILIASNYIKV